MGLIDDLAAKVTGAAGAGTDAAAGAASNAMGALTNLLGSLGGDGGVADQVLSLVRDPAGGGLAGLVSKLEASGLGEQVKSWIGTGQNLPVDASALTQALGADKVAAMAQSAGVDVGALGAKLAEILPKAVDAMTPDGKLPG